VAAPRLGAENGIVYVLDTNIMDVEAILKNLATRRSIFHSEADFQHALAWDIHQSFPDASIRLELPVLRDSRSLHVDIWITHQNCTIAIELKYKSRKLKINCNGESFNLLDHGAQDLGRYDFIKDIYRLEQLVLPDQGSVGCAVLLTNDSSYWNASTKISAIDADFRLHESIVLAGSRKWREGASAGTMKNREMPIDLAGIYHLRWRDYETLETPKNGVFRYLFITIPSKIV
jgi:hypothetical protein